MEKRRTETYQIRLTKEEKEMFEEAAKRSDTITSRVIRSGAIKEAKRILKEIEKKD